VGLGRRRGRLATAAALAAGLALTAGAGPARAGWAPVAAGVLVTPAQVGGHRYAGTFREWDAVLTWALPWARDLGAWRLKGELEAAAGVIRVNDRARTTVLSAGPVAVLARGWLALHAGIRPTYLHRYQLDTLGMGDHVQFTSHLGVLLRPWPRLGVGGRIQHVSNGGIGHINPGVNLATVEVRVDW
jgi:hypothetical protein